MPDQSLVLQSQSPETREEAVSRGFYEWEKRGRGWHIYPYPVELEPPFRPFYINLPAPAAYDDARKPTFFSRLFGTFSGDPVRSTALANLPAQDFDDEPDAEFSSSYSDAYTELRVMLPQTAKVAQAAAEQLLLSLDYAQAPVSFEVVGTCDETIVQFAGAEGDLGQIKQQLRAHLPEALIAETETHLENAWTRGGEESLIVDFGLSNEFLLPLEVIQNFDPDPLAAVVGALEGLEENEAGVLQVLFTPARRDWATEMLHAVRNFDGTPFFANAPEMVAQTKQKISRPLYAAVIRVAARSDYRERARRIARSVAGAFAAFASPASNELIPLSNDDYDRDEHERALLDRHSRRAGMILNSEELASLVHPPSHAVWSEKLARSCGVTKAAPRLCLNQPFILGENAHNGLVQTVGLNLEQRTQHLHLVGASGGGKSTLLLNLIRQDAERGQGLAVFDPHGDLIDDVMAQIPESRINDVILFDPADSDYPIGFNPLQANSDAEKTLLASDLVATFRRFSTTWGDVMDAVLANAILAIVESERGGTLFDLKRLLVEKEFRAAFMKTVSDDAVRYFFEHEYAALAGRSQSSVLVRLDAFLRNKIVRNVVCQRHSKLDFRRVMDERQILLVKLSQGIIGEENANLLGSLLVGKLHQTALSRADTAKEERRFFGIYLDEFHNFITPSMAQILSGIRKFNVGLHLAHQEFRQLQSKDTDAAQSVLSNCYTRVCFRLGDSDAERFAAGFSRFDAHALQNLGVGQAIVRVERAEYDFNLQTSPAPKVDREVAQARRAAIIAHSRERYAAPKTEPAQPDATPTANQTSAKDFGQESVSASEAKAAAAESAPKSAAAKLPVYRKVGAVGKPPNEPDVSPAANEQAAAGRGGHQHRYLQSLVKRLAENKGYLVTVEQPVLGSAGQVDVALEENGAKKIAVEISVTSTVAYELQNIQKCLASGFETVVLIVADKRKFARFSKELLAAIPAEQADRVKVLLPDDFPAFLDQIAAPNAGDGQEGATIKGRRVSVKLKSVEENEQKARKQTISKVLLNAFKRSKSKE